MVWETSRISRDGEELASFLNLCQTAGTSLIVGGTELDPAHPQQRLMLSVSGAFAEVEALPTRARILRNVQNTAEARRPHGRVPYGYRRIYDERSGVLLEQVPDEAPSEENPNGTGAADVVRFAAEAVLQGETLRSIAERLNQQGVVCPRKPRKATPVADQVTRWDASSLRQILLKPSNAGLRQHTPQELRDKWQRMPVVVGGAAWEPLIEPEEWERLRARLTNPDRVSGTPRGPAARHLLSNIARCESCGRRLAASTTQGRMPRAYTCRWEECRRKVTVSVVSADAVVEGTVRELLGTRAVVQELYSRWTAAQAAETAEVATAAQLRAALVDKRAELVEAMANGMSPTLAAQAETAFLKKVEEAEAREATAVVDPTVRTLFGIGWTPVQRWDAMTLVEKRALLRRAFEIAVRRATTRGRIFDPRRVDVSLAQLG